MFFFIVLFDSKVIFKILIFKLNELKTTTANQQKDSLIYHPCLGLILCSCECKKPAGNLDCLKTLKCY